MAEPAADVVATRPEATVLVSGPRALTVRYRRRETGQRDETPWIDAWKPLPPDLHAIVHETRDVTFDAVAVDVREVSNADFHRFFLIATSYRPQVANRFLAHWVDGVPPADCDDAPVTFVSLDDARAYASWRGCRLPTPDEWQAAIEDGAQRATPLVWNWTASERNPTASPATRCSRAEVGTRASESDWYVDGGEKYRIGS